MCEIILYTICAFEANCGDRCVELNYQHLYYEVAGGRATERNEC